MTANNFINKINELNEAGAYQQAFDTAQEALSVDDRDASFWIGAGNALHGLSRFEEAEKAYIRASELDLTDVIGLSNLAGVYFEQKRWDEGVDVCEKAISRNPDYVNIYIHRGNLLTALERHQEALEAYSMAEELSPKDPLVLFNKAHALSSLDRLEEAVSYYERLLEKKPDDADYLTSIAAVLERLQRFEGAAAAYLKLLSVDNSSTTHITLGGCLYNLLLINEDEKALPLIDVWLEQFPDNPIALHTLETIRGTSNVKRASAEYVKELFDAFADSFDDVLKGLEYQAPVLVAKTVAVLDMPEKSDILDLGCGTGLCAVHLDKENVPFVSLVGVDLSDGMLEKAGERKLYTSLEKSDIIAFLPQKEMNFDLIISADVFTYLGDLSELCKGISFTLKPGGHAVFTVSEAVDDPDAYVLEPSGRFMHGKQYIIQELEKNGMFVEQAERVELRKELGEPVWGLLIVARKAIKS